MHAGFRIMAETQLPTYTSPCLMGVTDGHVIVVTVTWLGGSTWPAGVRPKKRQKVVRHDLGDFGDRPAEIGDPKILGNRRFTPKKGKIFFGGSWIRPASG